MKSLLGIYQMFLPFYAFKLYQLVFYLDVEDRYLFPTTGEKFGYFVLLGCFELQEFD